MNASDQDRLFEDLPRSVQLDIIHWRASQTPPPELKIPPVLGLNSGHRPRRFASGQRTLTLVAAAAVILIVGVAVGLARPNKHLPNEARDAVGLRLVGQFRPVTLGSMTAAQIGQAQTTFGLDLLRQRCPANSRSNDVLSPASAALALSMLDAGARGETGAAISRLLHLPSWNSDVVAALQRQHEELSSIKELQLSNHLYTQVGVRPAPQVLNDLATAERADLQTLNFEANPPEATSLINARVSSDTHKMIPALYDQPLNPTTQTVLVNAAYLNAAWQRAFLPAQRSGFRTGVGKTVETPLMSSQADAGQRRIADGWTSVSVPYSDGRLQAVFILPPAGAGGCAIPNYTQMNMLTSGQPTRTALTVPTLNETQTAGLRDDLAALGLPLNGDYSGFGDASLISGIAQKTVLRMDEHGTTAAAASGISVGISIARNSSNVIFDRPYILVIRDVATGTPLFMSRINDPSAASVG